MKPIFAFIIYVFGFIVFYNLLSYLKADEYVFFFLTPKAESSLPTSKEKKNTQKKEEILTPEGSKKPLALTKQEIGRHTWALLHSMAAAYPLDPTEKDKKLITQFMFGLAHNFPCKICGNHLMKLLNKKGVKNNSREELVQYMCDIHNIVNKVLNKEQFDCAKAAEIWGGDCGCEV